MKRKIILSDSEIATIISELDISINSTDDYSRAMYLSNIVKKLKNNSGGDYLHIVKPHNPNKPLAMAR